MKNETEMALKTIVIKAKDSRGTDAMQLTQAALNLAHVLTILDTLKRNDVSRE